MPLLTIARGRVYNWSHQVGGRTSGRTSEGEPTPGFNKPNGIAVGKDDIVYVLDRTAAAVAGTLNPCVHKVKIRGPLEEEYIGLIGRRFGREDGQFIWPSSIALDKDENIYVSDDSLHRISIFDKDGNFLSKWGTLGSGPGEINSPSGLALDGDENIYVVDALNHRVQKFTKEGLYLDEWGRYGSRDGEFNIPWGITVDDNDNVYVADWKNHRVQKFSPDGTFLLQFGRPAPGAGDLNYPVSYPRHIPFSHLHRLDGADTGELNHPSAVAVDKDGDVYVADWGNDRVQIYTPEGEFFASLLGDARQYSRWAQAQVNSNPDVIKAIRRARDPEHAWRLDKPTAIGIDHERNRIIIADQFRRRIQIYTKERDYIAPQFNL